MSEQLSLTYHINRELTLLCLVSTYLSKIAWNLLTEWKIPSNRGQFRLIFHLIRKDGVIEVLKDFLRKRQLFMKKKRA